MPKNDTRMVAVNSTITLSCIVETYSTPDMKWYKDLETITSENLYISSYKSTRCLNYTFTVHENSTGVYICIVQNLNLKLESNISLTVYREQSSIANDAFVTDTKLYPWVMFFIGLLAGAVLNNLIIIYYRSHFKVIETALCSFKYKYSADACDIQESKRR
ncbi:hypothetical protein CBL_09947 [Carabus blaptoides fortunei]